MPVKVLKVGYATYPSVKLMADKLNAKKKKTFGMKKELLFGDHIEPYIKNGEYVTRIVGKTEYIKVHAREADGYIKPDQIQENRILEVNFIDVGQGDGCHVVTPNDDHFLIDAGPSDNMYRFLKWRFNLHKAKNSPPPFNVIISHSDMDHYKGFQKIFSPTADSNNQFSVPNIYHNGLIERSGKTPDSLGNIVQKGGTDYIEITQTDAAAKKMVNSVNPKSKGETYLKTLGMATEAKITPLYKSSTGKKEIFYEDKKRGIAIEVLGPFTTKVNSKETLPVFGKKKGSRDERKGKTKNGHSILLRLTYGNIKVFLGGDLNTYSEDYLLEKYTGIPVAAVKEELKAKSTSDAKRERLQKQLDEAVMKARKYFEVDVAKSCHHGSADFTSEFLRALNASATVISSGDDEPHCHPRPDTLGTIGKHSYGERSLVFCTELARSSKEFIKLNKDAKPGLSVKTVTVYGMINLRTDGNKAIIAQKLERKSPNGSWDINKLEWNANTGKFEYIND